MSTNDKVNILMVDDNPAKLLTYEAILGGLGENLLAATSGREALENLLYHDVAVILLDVSMPDMNGFEIADIIRQHPRFQRVAIIFVSAIHLNDLELLKGYQRGAVDYIHVPVVPEVLRAKVAVFADLHRKTRQLETLNLDLERRVRERTEKLWESEGQFRTLANSIPQLAWMSAPDGSRLWYNQRWYSYTGTSTRQILGDSWRKYYHPSHVERVCTGLQHSLDTGEEWEDTHPILGQDGRYRWFLSRAVPIRDSQKRVVRWFATATDVTAQIEAEERIKILNRNLAQQINQLQTIMQVLPIGVAVAEDPECRKVSGNAALLETLGMNANENLSRDGLQDGVPAFEVFRDNQRLPARQRPLQRAIRTKSAIHGSELEIRRRDGNLIHAVVSASPLLDDFGEVQGAVATCFDVTSRRTMEDTLRERAELMDLASEAIMVRDRRGLVRYWNAGAERLYGWKREEIIGRHMHNTLETTFPIPFPEVQDITAKTGRWEGNLIQRTKNGTEVTVACRKALKTEEDGSGTILQINRDITSELQMQEVLQKTEKLAAMGRVAGMIAHEINNPLEAVINAVFLLLNNPSLDSDARDFAEMANAELRRVAHITRQTLSFYRESRQPVPVAIAEILEDILSLHQQSLTKSGVTPQVKMRSRHAILGLPGELRQVFLNLVVNAIQSMPEGGRLRVHVHESTERKGLRKGVRISISDTGTGIQPEDGEKIFEPFFTTKSMKGTGLGLWISRGIVHKYEGTIRYRSLRRGCRNMTCFSVFLPGAHVPLDVLPFDTCESPDQLPLWEPKAS